MDRFVFVLYGNDFKISRYGFVDFKVGETFFCFHSNICRDREDRSNMLFPEYTNLGCRST